MKKYTCILAGFLLLSTLITACSKKKGASGDVTPAADYYVMATLNGKVRKFTVDPWVQYGGNDNRIEHLVFSGMEQRSNTATENVAEFGIDIWRMGDNISAGNTYLNRMEASYCEYTPDMKAMLHNFNSHTPDPENFRLTIEQLDKKTVKGTFEGTLQEADGGYIEVKDGSFYVPVK